MEHSQEAIGNRSNFESVGQIQIDEEIDVEGYEKSLGDGWGDFPLDAVFIRPKNRTVNETVKRIGQGRYILNPDFQRDFVWTREQQSKLIESCIMRIPLPVFYVAERDDGKIVVVDGLQRFTTFKNFIDGKFSLTGFSKDYPLQGKKI